MKDFMALKKPAETDICIVLAPGQDPRIHIENPEAMLERMTPEDGTYDQLVFAMAIVQQWKTDPAGFNDIMENMGDFVRRNLATFGTKH